MTERTHCLPPPSQVVSNMSYKTAPLTHKAVEALQGGHALFTMPKVGVRLSLLAVLVGLFVALQYACSHAACAHMQRGL